ncbi:MAG: exodeoxyribonuclease III [Polyangia bacterium]
MKQDTLRVASWNVNSIRARLPRLEDWLREREPDVVCLQELKGEAGVFPGERLEQLGYRTAVFGQRTYNGVAVLSREEPRGAVRGLPGDGPDPQARLIEVDLGTMRVLSVYVPNGGEVGSEKYAFKLEWLSRLTRRLAELRESGRSLLVCGDFNAAREERDVSDVDEWEGSVLYNPEMRAAMLRILDLGFVDLFRSREPAGGHFSWWDYRQRSFARDRGLRIDYLLASAELADSCVSCWIDRDQRGGEKPSDHAPVVAEIALNGRGGEQSR